jgi:hypothetical protein
MKNEVSIALANSSDILYSPYELETGEIVSAERPDVTTPDDLRIVNNAGLFSLTSGTHWAEKTSKSKNYYKLPSGTIIKLVVK